MSDFSTIRVISEDAPISIQLPDVTLPQSSLPTGIVVKHYKILSMLGQGSYGITYLAQDMEKNQHVVIKENFPKDSSLRIQNTHQVIPSTKDAEESYQWALNRFLDEAALLKELSHPNIVPVLDSFEEFGTAYYVMPHIGGRELIQTAPPPEHMTEKWLLPVLVCLLNALAYMHERNILHRDIKPNNILMDGDCEPVLIDFGTARTLQSTHTHTKIGTPGFTPLEQYSSHGKRGPWSDFYALGATCYLLITGEMPPDVHERVDEDNYQPLANRPTLSRRFSKRMLGSIDIALRMNIRERWQSASEWLAALHGAMFFRRGAPRPFEIQRETEEKSPRKKLPFLLAGLGIAILSATATILLLPAINREDDAAALLVQQQAEQLERLRAEQQQALERAEQLEEQYAREQAQEQAEQLAEQEARQHAEQLAREQAEQRAREQAEQQARLQSEQEARRRAEQLAEQQARQLEILRARNRARQEQNQPSPNELLISSASKNDTRNILIALERGADINHVSMGRTALHIAASTGQTESVRTLATYPGINLNWRSPLGHTAIYEAASKGHQECVRILASLQGTDVNLADDQNMTPLYAATRFNHFDCVRALMFAGSRLDTNAGDKNGITPLCLAANKGYYDCLALMLTTPEVDINKPDHLGRTPLHHAAERINTTCVELLLRQRGIKVNTRDHRGWTPLRAAMSRPTQMPGRRRCYDLIYAAGGRR